MSTNILRRDRFIKRSFIARLTRIESTNLDIPLVLLLALLMVISLFTIYSASGGNVILVSKQAIFFVLGFVIMFTVARFEIYHFRRFAFILYIAGLFLLILTLFIGPEINGSKRWINLGLVNFQPAEYMKIVLPLTICWLLTYKPLPISWYQLAAIICVVFVPVALVFLQPDLGTAIIIVSSSACLIFLAGIRMKIVVPMLVIFAASLPLAWRYILHDYHKNRILSFVDPDSDPLGSGWSLIQSKIAVGTGGVFGKGWGNSHQANYEFLPETHTDFIFSVFAEENGLLGVLLLLLIYFLVIIRSFYIAMQARDSFEKLFCGGLIFIFSSYILINIGMVTGLLPIVGIPLPLISYGGTSLVTAMGAFGILMSVAVHSHKVT